MAEATDSTNQTDCNGSHPWPGGQGRVSGLPGARPAMGKGTLENRSRRYPASLNSARPADAPGPVKGERDDPINARTVTLLRCYGS